MIQFSLSALHEVKRLQSKHPDRPLVRLGIQPGGCADWIYTLEFIDQASAEDTHTQYQGLEVVVQAQHLPYLTGLTLDYTEDLMGGGFRFHNPQALKTCSCGHSFTVEAGQPSA